jgi:hypothetical protein
VWEKETVSDFSKRSGVRRNQVKNATSLRQSAVVKKWQRNTAA